jgi:NitT/TauT family transport system ATP-binding protein
MILGGNPARIMAELNVTFAHPRDRKDNAFIELVDEIYKTLTRKKTDRAPAMDIKPTTVPEAAAAVRYPALPQARPGSIAGLLEILADHGGQYDLYRLADELTMDVDDILPIVDATAMLQYVQIHEGDVVITPQGTEFANADILSRKVLFGEAALKNVTLLRQIDHSLRAKSNHTLPDDFFHDILEKHFSEEAIQQQLDTAINWGRYAELFDHDADSGQFLTMKES